MNNETDQVIISRKDYDRLIRIEQKACDVVNIMSKAFYIPNAIRNTLEDIIRLVKS